MASVTHANQIRLHLLAALAMIAFAIAPIAATAQPTVDLFWGGSGSSVAQLYPNDVAALNIVVDAGLEPLCDINLELTSPSGVLPYLTLSAEICPIPPNLGPSVCNGSLGGLLGVASVPSIGIGGVGPFVAGGNAFGTVTLGRVVIRAPPAAGSVLQIDVSYPSAPLGVSSDCAMHFTPPAQAKLIVIGDCSNGTDDDGDGFVDLQDPGCRSSIDSSETHLRPGDVLLAQSLGGVSVFDPRTTRLSPLVGSSEVASVWDLHVEPEGPVLATDPTLDALVRIDPETGLATTLASGGSITDPHGVVPSGPDTAFVSASASDVVVDVDLLTGTPGIPIGGNPPFSSPQDLLVDPSDGSLLSSDTAGLFRISDPLGTPGVSSVSASGIPRQIVFDGPDSIIVADSAANIPYRLDLGTSVETPLLSAPAFTFLRGVAKEEDGLYLFSDFDDGKIVRVSEANDTATVLETGSEGPVRHLATVPDDFDLSLELTDTILVDGGDPDEVDVGDTLELTAVVTNVGANSADLLSLESGLDPNLTLVASSLSTTQGSIIEGSLASDPRLEVDLGSLAPAASATVTWEVVVSDPAPAQQITTNAWIRREKLILAESDDPTTRPAPDPNLIGVGDFGVLVSAAEKISDVRGRFSGPGNPGAVLLDGDLFGQVAPLGDLDGNGVTDLAVGASIRDLGGPGRGAVFILLRAPDGTIQSRVEIGHGSAGLVLADGDDFGFDLANLGDVDGDGVTDLAVGARSDDTAGSDAGAVYVLFLNATGTLKDFQKITEGVGVLGDTGNVLDLDGSDNFGGSVGAVGDLNGDGVPDLAVGAVRDDDAGSNTGAVYVLMLKGGVGEPNPGEVLGSPVKISAGNGNGFVGPAGGQWVGRALDSVGDTDGDDRPELAVGVSLSDDGGADTGEVWLWSLRTTAAGDAPGDVGKVLTGSELLLSQSTVTGLSGALDAGDRFGTDLATVGDLDGDDVAELAVSAPFDNDGGADRGAVYILFLDPTHLEGVKRVEKISDTQGAFPEPLDDGDSLGGDLALLGVTAAGVPELALGAAGDDDGGTDRGAVYVVSLETPQPVPEPGALIGLVSGIALLAAIGRKRFCP